MYARYFFCFLPKTHRKMIAPIHNVATFDMALSAKYNIQKCGSGLTSYSYYRLGNVVRKATARKHKNNVFEDKTFGNSLLEKLEFHGMNLVIIFCIFYKIQNQTVPLCIIQNFFLITNVMKEAEVGAIPIKLTFGLKVSHNVMKGMS